MKNFLKRLLSGIAIGVGAAVPGVSGGTIAIILNTYDSIITAVSNIFKRFKESIIVLIPILLGVVGALIPCIILFDKLFEGMLFIMICIFAGLMMGSLPKITSEVKNEKRTKPATIAFIVCLIIGLAIGVCSVFLADKVDIKSHFLNPEWWFYLVMIPIGVIGSFALVVPGISGSMLLLILGFYTPLIEIASSFIKGQATNPGSVIGLIGCFGLGVLLGFFFTSKLMSRLLNKYHLTTMYGIIGFIIGSIIVLFYNHTIVTYYTKMFNNGAWMKWYIELIIGIICLIAFTICSYLLLRYSKKKQKEK